MNKRSFINRTTVTLFLTIAFGIVGFPIAILITYFIFGVGYHSKNIAGTADAALVLKNCTLSQDELYKTLQEKMPEAIFTSHIPAKIKKSKLIMGSFWNSYDVPMLVFKNTEFGYKFFDMGIAIENNILYFPLMGNSRENFKRNRYIQDSIDATLTGNAKVFMPTPNPMILQKEEAWRASILECLKQVLELQYE